MPTRGPEVVEFFETFVTLTGSYAGEPFVPDLWVQDWLHDLYEETEEGKRVVRTALLGVPRKNAKSTISAGIGLYELTMAPYDAEPEVICAAADRAQAKIVHNMAKSSIQRNPELSNVLTVHRDEIFNLSAGPRARWKAVSSDAGLAHGLNPSCAIIDELHAHKDGDLLDALESGSAMRNSPITIIITTAGFDLESVLGELFQYGLQVESGEVDDPSFLFRWYGPRPGEEYDPLSEETWAKFNPSYDRMNHDDFRSQAEKASKTNRISEFIRYRLNGWTDSENEWFGYGVLEGREDKEKSLQPGDRITIGFDGAFFNDCTAIVATRIEDFHQELVGFWERPKNAPDDWHMPVPEIRKTILDLFDTYKVIEFAADPFRFEETLTLLEEEGYPIVAYMSSSPKMMTQATKIFQDTVIYDEMTHNGDPRYIRHIKGVSLFEDQNGARISKKGLPKHVKIDAAVAAAISMHRAKFHEKRKEVSAFTI